MPSWDHREPGRRTSQAGLVLTVCAVVLLAAALAVGAAKAGRSAETVQGHDVHWWAARSMSNGRYGRQEHRNSVKRGHTIRRLKTELRRRYTPTFEHYFTIAARTYGVDRATLERRGRCESVNFTDFYNETPIYNGEHAQGVMGFIPSTFNSTPFAGLDVRYDHLANIMAGAWMHKVGRGGEWACR